MRFSSLPFFLIRLIAISLPSSSAPSPHSSRFVTFQFGHSISDWCGINSGSTSVAFNNRVLLRVQNERVGFCCVGRFPFRKSLENIKVINYISPILYNIYTPASISSFHLFDVRFPWNVSMMSFVSGGNGMISKACANLATPRVNKKRVCLCKRPSDVNCTFAWLYTIFDK